MALFNRSTKQVVRVQPPTIPSDMSLENGAIDLLEQIRRNNNNHVRICSDLIAMRDRLDREAENILEQAAKQAAQLDFASKQATKMIEFLHSEAPQQEQEPVVSNGMAQLEGPSTTQPIGFLSPGARP